MEDRIDPIIRIYKRQANTIEDLQLDMTRADFGGQIPTIGDKILKPYVLQGLDRYDPANRSIWTVTERIFNPRDLQDYILLVVEEASLTPSEHHYVR